MIENQQLTAITDFRPLRQGSAVSIALNDRGERRNCEGSPLRETARARERALGAGGGPRHKVKEDAPSQGTHAFTNCPRNRRCSGRTACRSIARSQAELDRCLRSRWNGGGP